MTQNLFMARTQTNFRLDDWLKEQLDEYCEQYGLKKERMVEALVFAAVVKGSPQAKDVFELIQELAARGKAGSQKSKKAG